MENKLYTIGELAKLTHASIKTIRYYDEVNLLKPKEKSDAGYRLYSFEEAQKLQYILVFKLMGFSLSEIRKIVTGETDVTHAAKLQLHALKQQTKNLHRIQVLLESAIENSSLQSPDLIQQIGEELQMNELQRKEMVLEQLCQVMMGGHHNEKWANTFFEEHKEWLLNLDLQTKDQMDAFYDLKNLVSDPDFIREMKKSMGNFWSMVKDNNIPATEWERDMKTLTQKAIKAHAEGVEADSEEVQALVDEWMGIIAKNINKPINKQFVKIFKQRVDEMSGRQSQRYWEIVCRISPEKIAESKANQLLARGLDYKLENYEGE